MVVFHIFQLNSLTIRTSSVDLLDLGYNRLMLQPLFHNLICLFLELVRGEQNLGLRMIKDVS